MYNVCTCMKLIHKRWPNLHKNFRLLIVFIILLEQLKHLQQFISPSLSHTLSSLSPSPPPCTPTAFLAGYPQSCVMSFMTGSDTSIPDNAAVSIVTHSDIHVECSLKGQEVKVSSDRETKELAFKLPEIPPESSHDIDMTLLLPSMQTVGVVNHTHQSPPRAWKHEVILILKKFSIL